MLLMIIPLKLARGADRGQTRLAQLVDLEGKVLLERPCVSLLLAISVCMGGQLGVCQDGHWSMVMYGVALWPMAHGLYDGIWPKWSIHHIKMVNA